MAETMKDRIRQRLDELGLSVRGAALKGGGTASMIRNVLTGGTTNPRGDTLTKIARGLEVSEQWLLTGVEADPQSAEPAPGRAGEVRLAAVPIPSASQLPRDVPVMGTVAGSEIGKGSFQITPDVIDYVRRPFALMGAKDVYALYVEGESMIPRFEPGDLVFVHPHRKAKPGDYVVVQEPDSNNGEPRGFIKRLVAITTKLIRTEQFNPKSNIDFVIRPGTTVHKVMTDGDLYGF